MGSFWIMKIIYKKSDKSVKGWGSHSAPSDDTEGMIEISDSSANE